MSSVAPLPPELPAPMLARRRSLSRKPDDVELAGDHVAVRSYTSSDADELHQISSGAPVTRAGRCTDGYDADELIWRFMPTGPFPSAAELGGYHDYLAGFDDARVFSVVDRATGELVGSLSYLANQPEHLKIEIGNVWYTPPAQGTGINGEATGLLVGHALGLGYQRVEWKCHADNHRSRRAAEKLGFRFEGIQEAHYIHKRRSRDTAWYRILAREHRRDNLRETSGP